VSAGGTKSPTEPFTSGEQAALLLSAIIDSSDDAIISKDLNGVVTSWNKGAERLFGYTAAEMIGQPITILIPIDRQDEEPKILSALITSRPFGRGRTANFSISHSRFRRSGT